jgi:nucleotide-binding universal stress UspA family protein
MSGCFNRILVPVDFEPASLAAFECAKGLARSFGARLFLLHAVDDPLATGVWTPEVYVPASAAARDALLGDATKRLTGIVRPEDAQYNPTVEVRAGAAIPVIEDYAREQGIDLIVMGTHGRRGLAHMLLGSVAERLVRTAPCPVLTVRQEDRSAAESRCQPEAAHACATCGAGK